jgi:hypothetical protein
VRLSQSEPSAPSERPAVASGGMARWRDVLERLNVKFAILRQRGVDLQGQRRSTRSVYE